MLKLKTIEKDKVIQRYSSPMENVLSPVKQSNLTFTFVLDCIINVQNQQWKCKNNICEICSELTRTPDQRY